MIEYIRRKSNSLIFKIFLWLVIFSFAIVGFTGAFSIVGNTAVSVDGKSYSVGELYQDTAQLMAQGDIKTASEEELYQLTLMVANQKALEMSLASEVKRQGFTASDETVKQTIFRDPNFVGPNGFDKSLYERYLKAARLSEVQLLDMRREQIAQGQYESSLLYGIKAPPYYQKMLDARLQKLARLADVKYKLISVDDIKDIPAPSDSDIEAFYNQNLENFRAPEYRKVKIFEFSKADFEKINPEGNFTSSLNQLMDGIDDDLSAGFTMEQLQEKHGGHLNTYTLNQNQEDMQGRKVDIPAEILPSLFADNMISPVIIGSDDTGVANGLYSFAVEEVIASRIMDIAEVKADIVAFLNQEYKQKALAQLTQDLSIKEGSFEEVTQAISSPLIVKTNIDQVNLASEINPFMNSRILDNVFLSEEGQKIVVDIPGNAYIFEVTAFKEGDESRLAALKEQRMNEIDQAFATSVFGAFIEDVNKNHKVKIKAGNIRTTVVPSLRSAVE